MKDDNQSSSFSRKEQKEFMRLAISMARKGAGHVHPNPLVGAVIVKDGKVIGRGFHRECGGPHAEKVAITCCIRNKKSVEGAALFVTLTPCSHTGRQPPCTDLIINSKIKEVIIGSSDPNPKVKDAVSKLKEAGIIVTEGVLKKQCDELNAIFFHYITTNRPYVSLKFASTLDGKIATKTGESEWITSERSRRSVQYLRKVYTAILVGIGTVEKDDPLLTCKLPGSENPTRIIVDTNLRISLKRRVVQTALTVPTIIATARENEVDSSKAEKIERLKKLGCEVIFTSKNKAGEGLNLKELTEKLGEMEIDSLIIEGGSRINASALETGIVNHIYAYYAPLVFGGTDISAVGGNGIEKLSDAKVFKLVNVTKLDGDVLLEFDKIEL